MGNIMVKGRIPKNEKKNLPVQMETTHSTTIYSNNSSGINHNNIGPFILKGQS